jgi:hypothetical protein
MGQAPQQRLVQRAESGEQPHACVREQHRGDVQRAVERVAVPRLRSVVLQVTQQLTQARDQGMERRRRLLRAETEGVHDADGVL